MKKFISKNGFIFNMDNVCYINYFKGKIKFIFNCQASDSRGVHPQTFEAFGPAIEIIACSNDEYKAIVNFLKSKDETYLELEREQ